MPNQSRVLSVGTGSIRRFTGIALLTLCALAAGTLATHSRLDPSLDTTFAPVGPVHNMLGTSGAVLSDLLLQLFGIVAWLPVLVLLVWGARLVAGRAPLAKRKPLLTALTFFFSIPSLSIGFAAILLPSGWHLPGVIGDSGDALGGSVGNLLFEGLTEAASLFGSSAFRWPLAAFSAFLGLFSAIYASGLSWAECQKVGQFIEELVLRLGWRHSKKFQPRYSANMSISEGRDGNILGKNVPSPNLPKQPLPYELPPLRLLTSPPEGAPVPIDEDALAQTGRLLETVFEDFDVNGQIIKIRPGPVVTLYELDLAPGTDISQVIGLADDIARAMSAKSVRITSIPGRSVVSIELPNSRRNTIFLRELLSSEAFERAPAPLTLALGKGSDGQMIMVDLASMPHLLIAGTTGSGKSVAIDTMILSLLYRLKPEECRLILADMAEHLSFFDGIPHLLAPVISEPGKAVVALKWAVREMEDRYRAMSQLGVQDITGYNQRLAEARQKGEMLSRTVPGFSPSTGKPVYGAQDLDLQSLPFIVVVIAELADLVGAVLTTNTADLQAACQEIETILRSLAQKSRAAGIHLIAATERPWMHSIVNTNFPSRISFLASSFINSGTILGERGAQQLLGQGDMLYRAADGQITRAHGPFVCDPEVVTVAEYLHHQGYPRYEDNVTKEEEAVSEDIGGWLAVDDGLYGQAVALVAREGKASTSFIQRHLQIGYNRAARIIEKMEAEGVVSWADHEGKRKVLVHSHGD